MTKNKYNLSKEEYDLSKDTDEIESNLPNGSGKKRTWLWILLAILVIVGVIIAIKLAKGNDKTNSENGITPTEQVEQQLSNPVNESVTEESTIVDEDATETVEKPTTETEPADNVPTQVTQKTVAKPQQIAGATSNAGLTGDVEKDARLVIQGKFQNYPERKQLIEAAGGNYEQIQSKVNELMGR